MKITLNDETLADWFSRICRQYANRKAYENMGVGIKYDELYQQASAFAHYLQEDLNIQKGDRVAVMLPNLMQQPVVFFGIILSGAIVVNVNPLYTSRELSHQLRDSGAKTIIILENMAHVLAECINELPISNIILAKIADQFSQPKAMLVDFIVKRVKKMVPSYELSRVKYLKKIMRDNIGKVHQKAMLELDDVVMLQYTGGTTGPAKGAMLTHKSVLYNLMQLVNRFEENLSNIIQAEDFFCLVPLPLYHIYAAVVSLVTLHLGGVNLLITNPRDIPAFIKQWQVHQDKIEMTLLLNTLLIALMKHPDFSKINFSALKATFTGGMATTHAAATKWHKLTGCDIYQGYGLSEASPVVSGLEMGEFNGSCGKPLEMTEVKIIDDKGKSQPAGERGELCIKGPQVFLGYWSKPNETEKVLDESGWLKTGDIAVLNESGEITIVDRKKDMIIVSGFNVYPNEVEDELMKHPGVLEAGVIGVYNADGNEVVTAFIVKSDDSLTEQDIVAHCEKSLTNYKIPHSIHFIAEIPKNPVGKILRRELRKMR